MKTLNDIKQDMSDLYDALKKGEVEIKTADALANISGKFLKAEQLELAKAVFYNSRMPIALERLEINNASDIDNKIQ